MRKVLILFLVLVLAGCEDYERQAMILNDRVNELEKENEELQEKIDEISNALSDLEWGIEYESYDYDDILDEIQNIRGNI